MSRYGNIIFCVVLLFLVFVSAYLLPTIQDALVGYYLTEHISSFFLNVGSALIGATAIVASLVLFAMQVNIERLPYELFRRLSADRKLLGAFALAFFLALGVAALSIIANQMLLAYVIFVGIWAIVFILMSFMYAYRRALDIVSPWQQLNILLQNTCKELRIWSQRAQREKPLFECKESDSILSSPRTSTHDLALTKFFQRTKGQWTYDTKRSIQHVMSFARHYAEKGDYEVSSVALDAVAQINTAYIGAKGKTFYANNTLFDNSLSGDDVIAGTLERLRQNVQSGIARGDEQQIEQTLQSIAELILVYLKIDYSIPDSPKSHARLAAEYLANAVQATVPHGMVDVILNGQRLMGKSAQSFIVNRDPRGILTISEKIYLVACIGCSKKDYSPLTMEGMTQLANITFNLLYSPKNSRLRYVFKEVRKKVTFIVQLFLKTENTLLLGSYDMFLGTYYSSTSSESLRYRLEELVKMLLKKSSDDVNAQTIIRNIECWAEGLYKKDKELFLEAVNTKSDFSFVMIDWITGITEILLEVSTARACSHHDKEKLRKHACQLIITLSSVPDDENTIAFVETHEMTEVLFESAVKARNIGCNEIAKDIGKILLSWTFKGGKYQTGSNILEKGLFELAVFALMGGEEETECIRTSIAGILSSQYAPEQRIRDRAAREILKCVENLYTFGYRSSWIENAITQSDHEKLRTLMQEIANMLSPSITSLRSDGLSSSTDE